MLENILIIDKFLIFELYAKHPYLTTNIYIYIYATSLTGRAGSWWFNGNDHQITWMRCTHQPSPWIGDWGFFLFGPMMANHDERNPVQFWEPRAAVIKPYLFEATVGT